MTQAAPTNQNESRDEGSDLGAVPRVRSGPFLWPTGREAESLDATGSHADADAICNVEQDAACPAAPECSTVDADAARDTKANDARSLVRGVQRLGASARRFTGRALHEAERAWLLPTAYSMSHACALEGWVPDEPGSYCDRCGFDLGVYEAGSEHPREGAHHSAADQEFGCRRCGGRPLAWAHVVRLGAYEPPLRDWITQAKYHAWRRMATDLGRAMGVQIRAVGLAERKGTAGAYRPDENATGRNAPFENGPGRDAAVVTWIPSAPFRRLSRGIDHAHAIAQGVGAELGLPVTRLLRAKWHRAQRGLPLSKRVRLRADTFRPSPGANGQCAGRRVILVDDVLTTGATMRAGARALAACNPASITVAVAAVTPEPGRRRPTGPADHREAAQG